MSRYFIFLMYVVLGLSVVSQSYANLLVAPTRVAFEDRTRAEQVILINQSDTVQTYRLEWVEQTMTDSGEYVSVSAEQEFNRASEFVRFSPKQVTLQPGERQVVKLLARRPSGLADGEYRSHLKFTAIPNDLRVDQDDNAQGISMKMHLFLSYTIPVIVKKGEQKPLTTLQEVKAVVTDKGPRLAVTVSKSGNFGVSGDLVAYQKNIAGKEEIVARLNNVNIFHETDKRKVFLIPLNKDVNLSGEMLVRYEGKFEFLGNTLSEAIFRI